MSEKPQIIDDSCSPSALVRRMFPFAEEPLHAISDPVYSMEVADDSTLEKLRLVEEALAWDRDHPSEDRDAGVIRSCDFETFCRLMGEKDAPSLSEQERRETISASFEWYQENPATEGEGLIGECDFETFRKRLFSEDGDSCIDARMVERHLATLGKREMVQVREHSFETTFEDPRGVDGPHLSSEAEIGPLFYVEPDGTMTRCPPEIETPILEILALLESERSALDASPSKGE